MRPFFSPVVAVLALVVRKPFAGIQACLAGVESAHEGEPAVRLERALEDLPRVVVMVPADRRPVEPAVRDLHDQRVAAALRALAHLIDDDRRRMLVELVNQAAMDPLAVEAA